MYIMSFKLLLSGFFVEKFVNSSKKLVQVLFVLLSTQPLSFYQKCVQIQKEALKV